MVVLPTLVNGWGSMHPHQCPLELNQKKAWKREGGGAEQLLVRDAERQHAKHAGQNWAVPDGLVAVA